MHGVSSSACLSKKGVITAVEDRLLTTREAATKFRVHPTTIRRWVAGGLLKAAPTPGKHGRYWESDVRAAMTKDADESAQHQEDAEKNQVAV